MHIRGSYIKDDKLSPFLKKIFYIHELLKSCDIDVKQIQLGDNLTDLSPNPLPTTVFKKNVYIIDMRQLSDLSL